MAEEPKKLSDVDVQVTEEVMLEITRLGSEYLEAKRRQTSIIKEVRRKLGWEERV